MTSRYLHKNTNFICAPSSNQPCKDTTRFFSNLADKLQAMAISINDRINRIKEDSCKTIPGATVFASVDLPTMVIGVKYEYIEYIKRYGPPNDGVFNEEKLELLRQELGIKTSDYVI